MTPTKQHIHGRSLMILVLSIVLVLLVAACFIFILADRKETSREAELEQLGVNEQNEQYPEPEEQHPVWEKVPLSTLDEEQFQVDGWTVTYPGAELGVDVSSHQKEIDWAQLKEAGVDFAMLQLGYRGYTEGGLFQDESFERNIADAANQGIDVGVYFFSQAVTVEEAEQEADFVINVLARREAPLGVMFDWENITEGEARTDEVPPEKLTEFALAFCKKIEEAGYRAGVYFNLKQAYTVYDLDALSEYEFWLAEYCVPPTYEYEFSLWQYTSTATLPGIETKVDMNLRFPESAE